MHSEYESRLKSPTKKKDVKSPTKSPKKEKYSDRFIPTRSSSHVQRCLFNDSVSDTTDHTQQIDGVNSGSNQLPSDEGKTAYNVILKNEMINQTLSGETVSSNLAVTQGSSSLMSFQGNMFKFKTVKQEQLDSPFSLTPISEESQKFLSSPRKPPRKIPKTPFKVLEAPAISDDFYLNLVDWSSSNILAVGLGNCVYLWNASTNLVTKLCELSPSGNRVTSVNWCGKGNLLGVGTNEGLVEIYDVPHLQKIHTFYGHKSRVGTIAWNNVTGVISSGSRDRIVMHRDLRNPEDYCARLVGHKQEVCGLKWSYDGDQLASGGNDNQLLLWDITSSSPIHRFQEHTAAVKALAWSPHQRGLLASGGGTADRCIRFWNTLQCVPLHHVDTGSQVCNLEWSKNVNELVSTHGYSQNQITVWSYPTMTQLATLTGHKMRVLYLSSSPDGQTIVTGAGDQTLRFWNIFPSSKNAHGFSGPTSSLHHDLR